MKIRFKLIFITFAQLILGQLSNSETKTSESSSSHEHQLYSIYEIEFWINSFIAFRLCLHSVLIIFAGLCSGLTVGYLSIDELAMELDLQNGTQEEKQAVFSIIKASIILPILHKHHLLIATLLVSNAFAMEALPIFLHKIFPAIIAILFSICFVVIFGEVLPQAYCSGPNQIPIALFFAPFIKTLIVLLSVITYPTAWLLDKILGTHGNIRFDKENLIALVQMHQIARHNRDPKSRAKGLTQNEIDMIVSTFELKNTLVTKIMTPMNQVFAISNEARITEKSIRKIRLKGFSRIPILKKNDQSNVIGVLTIKNLLDSLSSHLNHAFTEIYKIPPALKISKDSTLLELLILFQTKRTKIAIITDYVKPKKSPGPDEILFSVFEFDLETRNKRGRL